MGLSKSTMHKLNVSGGIVVSLIAIIAALFAVDARYALAKELEALNGYVNVLHIQDQIEDAEWKLDQLLLVPVINRKEWQTMSIRNFERRLVRLHEVLKLEEERQSSGLFQTQKKIE
jgi:hypothetical protein